MNAAPRSGARAGAGSLSGARATAVGHRTSWLVVLVGGEAFYQVIRRVALATENPHLLPGMVLIGTLIAPVSFVTLLWGRDARHGVTLPVGLLTGLAGACVALSLSAVVEQVALDHDLLTTPVVGVVEEATKLAVTAAVLAWLVPGTARNGLVVGAACGAGFAVTETLGYSFVDYLRPGGGLAALDGDLLERSLFSPATHLAWAALTGCAWGFAISRGWRARGVAVLVATFATVASLHAVWDASATLGAYVGLTVIALALLAGALHRTTRLVTAEPPHDPVRPPR